MAVVQAAYVHEVSTRKVDDLMQALGLTGSSQSAVSRRCSELDAEVERLRKRRLAGSYPYGWLDATYLKVREAGRVQSLAMVIAVGVKANGERSLLGFDLGPTEDGAFWLEFLRRLLARGLQGVQLVTSAAHVGLSRPSRRPGREPAGSAAGCTACVTCWPRCPRQRSPWWRPASARFSSRSTGPMPVRS